MSWIIDLIIKKVLEAGDGFLQRGLAKGNRAQTLSGFVGAGAIYSVLTYLEQTMGCDLSQFKLLSFYPAIQGWIATGGYFTFAQPSKGDQQHVADGGNAA